MGLRKVQVVADPKALTATAASIIIKAAEQQLADCQHFFSLFLSGGSTPKALYELLASPEYRDQLNWSKVGIYFGDERAVPPDHPDSNYLMAHQAMLSKLPMPEPNIHRMRGEIAPEAAAVEYGQMLKARFAERKPDLILLGMGDDGHTASLFPGTAALTEEHHRCVANFVPKMDTWRITLTYSFLNSAHHVLIMLAGAGKADRLKEVLEGPNDPHRLPIQGIHPEHGTVTWLLDEAAASKLDKKTITG